MTLEEGIQLDSQDQSAMMSNEDHQSDQSDPSEDADQSEDSNPSEDADMSEDELEELDTIDKDYADLLEALKSTKEAVDQGALCKEFAKKHSLFFTGFSVATGGPMFAADPSVEQSQSDE